jgi:hypothetical protein
MKKLAILASGAAMLALAAPADAALLQFTISGTDTLSGVNPPPTVFASFQLDSSPVIDPINVAPGIAFAIADVAGTFQYGATTRTTPQPINFFNASQRGGLVVGTDFFLAFDGPQLYTGTEAAPTFRIGSFTLATLSGGSPIALTIAEVPAIPEPASWALMLAGFAMVGGAIRYRRRATSVAYA